jgi:hypothetical protein
MAFAFPTPDFMPCPDCGASLPVAPSAAKHVCDDEQRLDYRLFELRPEIERLSAEFGTWLETPHGRFEQWLAERDR